jgi:hypothetical protein
MAGPGSIPVQPPSPATATPDTAHGAKTAGRPPSQAPVTPGILDAPVELTLFKRMLSGSAPGQAPVCRPGDSIPASLLQDDAQSVIAASIEIRTPRTSCVAAAPVDLPFENRRGFEKSLKAQLDDHPGATVVYHDWKNADVDSVEQTLKAVGAVFDDEVGRSVKVFFTNLVAPEKLNLLNSAMSNFSGPELDIKAGAAQMIEKQKRYAAAMVELVHEVYPSTISIGDHGALVKSDGYRKVEAYVACLHEAQKGGAIEIRTLKPGETPKLESLVVKPGERPGSDKGRYINFVVQ